MSSMTFEDLDAWKQARKIVSEVYKLTRQDPLSKDFGLRDQLQRAAVSVMTNIAEGFERSTAPDKLHLMPIRLTHQAPTCSVCCYENPAATVAT